MVDCGIAEAGLYVFEQRQRRKAVFGPRLRGDEAQCRFEPRSSLSRRLRGPVVAPRRTGQARAAYGNPIADGPALARQARYRRRELAKRRPVTRKTQWSRWSERRRCGPLVRNRDGHRRGRTGDSLRLGLLVRLLQALDPGGGRAGDRRLRGPPLSLRCGPEEGVHRPSAETPKRRHCRRKRQIEGQQEAGDHDRDEQHARAGSCDERWQAGDQLLADDAAVIVIRQLDESKERAEPGGGSRGGQLPVTPDPFGALHHPPAQGQKQEGQQPPAEADPGRDPVPPHVRQTALARQEQRYQSGHP